MYIDMKKTYIQPASSLVAIKVTNTLLAGSIMGGKLNESSDEILPSGGEGDGTDVGAKGYNYYYNNPEWDMEE